MPTKPTTKLTIDVTATSLRKLKSAAALSGESVEDFVAKAAQAQARRVASPTAKIKLSARDFARVVDLIDNPPPPTPALVRLKANYRAMMTDDSNTSIAWTPR